MKKKVLFFSEAVTAAHVIRLYTLASFLDKAEYEIHFAVANRYNYVFDDPKIMVHHVNSIEGDVFISRVENAKQMYLFDELKDYVKEDIEIIKNIKPILVIGDMRQSLCVSTRLLNCYYVSLGNAYWNGDINNYHFPIPEIRKFNMSSIPFSSVVMKVYFYCFFKSQGKALNRLRKHYKLDKFDHCIDGWNFSDFSLYSDPECLFKLSSPPKNSYFLGPVTWEPKVALPDWWSQLDNTKSIIYVALGSSGDKALLPDIIKPLLEKDFQILISGVNPSDLAILPDHKNLFHAPYLPGSDAAKIANIVISNGGSPTSYQALSVGTPVIGIPRNLDQLMSMRSLENNNIGFILRPHEVGTGKQEELINLLMKSKQQKHAANMAVKINPTRLKEKFTTIIGQLTSLQVPKPLRGNDV